MKLSQTTWLSTTGLKLIQLVFIFTREQISICILYCTRCDPAGHGTSVGFRVLYQV